MKHISKIPKPHGYSFFLLILLALFIPTKSGFAQELTIGVPLQESAINIVESQHPFARLLLAATTQPLVRSSAQTRNHIRLEVADSFSASADGRSMELRLRKGAAFSNAELVSSSDVVASLERCIVTNKMQQKLVVSSAEKLGNEFISVTALEGGQDVILAFLETCPIFEERSLQLFGESLGSANLLIGTGQFQIVSRIQNREARLERLPQRVSWAGVFTVRGFADAKHALTALRSGTIDAFFTQELEVQVQAKNDPTLRQEACGVYNIILRRDLELACSPFLEPSLIKYSSL